MFLWLQHLIVNYQVLCDIANPTGPTTESDISERLSWRIKLEQLVGDLNDVDAKSDIDKNERLEALSILLQNFPEAQDSFIEQHGVSMLMDTIDPWSVSEESMNLVDVEWRIQVVVAMFEKRFYPLGRFAHGSSCLGFSGSGFHSDPKGVQAFRVNDLFLSNR